MNGASAREQLPSLLSRNIPERTEERHEESVRTAAELDTIQLQRFTSTLTRSVFQKWILFLQVDTICKERWFVEPLCRSNLIPWTSFYLGPLFHED
jgi:hypothetical protein